MKATILVTCLIAAMALAWLSRYSVSGPVLDKSSPVLLDRWTGRTYIYRDGAWLPILSSTEALSKDEQALDELSRRR